MHQCSTEVDVFGDATHGLVVISWHIMTTSPVDDSRRNTISCRAPAALDLMYQDCMQATISTGVYAASNVMYDMYAQSSE
jgi:hypothetical protein